MAWIELENAVNVRDLGGLPAGDGNRIRTGQLVRSDNLQDLSPSDVTRLVDEVGVTTVVDLRSTGEVTSEGPGPLKALASVAHVHLSLLPEFGEMTDVAKDALALNRERALQRDPENVADAFYFGYLEDRPDSVVGALRAIASAPGAALVHCAAGKDRTGVVVAMALSVAGVPRAEIVADYEATGERIVRILDRLRSSPTYAADIDNVPAHEHDPRPDIMRRFLDRLDSEYGGPLGWLGQHGFDRVDAERLRNKLVEE
ncbi:tyrosine-protein phosphatase [Actinophytocola algeriensis]|uniref:Protein tyrosine/serine phosphatase n=1 Tax=Actinophytocola algeriensis TaxID=1768010 RepID=A0A7W7Q6D7_9PSEU|nr:tyrosine-protein phosphatase [Actinophytocola algeriensis]MBB4907777.1 protein tyrosine/serine phosphatase [Actinophytocola algeriensis]MBE1479807.1 protein tyrosine/serine phosphatase [Actinophytocola algeriensis]